MKMIAFQYALDISVQSPRQPLKIFSFSEHAALSKSENVLRRANIAKNLYLFHKKRVGFVLLPILPITL